MARYGRLVRRAVGSVDYWAQAAMRRFVLDISNRMHDQNISRTQLASKIEATPAYVTKVLRGDVNFTLETMTKLALAVGGRLNVEIVDHGARWKQPPEWHYERPQIAPSGQTRTIEFQSAGAANESPYEYGTVVRRTA